MLEQEKLLSSPTSQGEYEIHLMEYLAVLVKRRKLILTSAAILTGVIAGVSFALPNSFRAESTIMPIQKDNMPNMSSILGSMGGGLGVLASQVGISDGGAAEKFTLLLRTRTLNEAIIRKHDLLPVLFESQWDEKKQTWKKPWYSRVLGYTPPTLEEAVNKMNERLSVEKDKKTEALNVSFEASNPELSAKVTNAYIEELNLFLKNNALSTAKRNRLFVEDQLQKVQGEMADYEQSLKNFQQKNKVVSLDAQAEASVKAYTDLKSKLMASEVELKLLETSSISGDPRINLKRQEVSELKKQLSQFENGSETSPIVSFHQAASLGLNYARLKRDLIVREKVFELLTQQYEMAKIQESQEDISFQVLDTAIAPEKKHAPRRGLIIAFGLFASTLASSLLALIVEYWSRNRLALRRFLENSPA